MPSCSRVLAIPGPQGPAGTSASNGAAGANAFTTAPSGFTMPAEQANVTVAVGDSTWMVAGQNVFASGGGASGTFQVVSKPNSTSVILKNLENTASSLYTANSAPGTVFPALTGISPGGVQGAAGATPVDALLAANNLDDVAVAATARTNLGLGTMAVQNAATVAITGGTIAGITDLAVADGGTGASTIAGAQQALDVEPGVDVQAFDAGLQSLAALPTAADRMAYSTGVNVWAETVVTSQARALLDDVLSSDQRSTLGLVIGTNVQAFDATLLSLAALGTASERYAYTTGVDTWAEDTTSPTSRALIRNTSIQLWNAALGGLMPRYGRLGSINAVNLNSTADTTLAVDAYVANTRYRIDKIMVENASISLTTATAGVFTAAGGGGTTVAATQALSALTSSTKFLALTLEAITGTDVFTASPLYFRVVTPQGAAATAAVHLFGWSFDSP